MSFNVVRVGSSGILGVAAGVVSTQTPLTIIPATGTTPATTVGWDTVVAGVGLVLGAGMQFLAPTMLTNFADGLTDGGLALVARDGVAKVMPTILKTAYRANPAPAAGRLPTPFADPYPLNGAMAGARYGNVHNPTPLGATRAASATVEGLPNHRVS